MVIMQSIAPMCMRKMMYRFLALVVVRIFLFRGW